MPADDDGSDYDSGEQPGHVGPGVDCSADNGGADHGRRWSSPTTTSTTTTSTTTTSTTTTTTLPPAPAIAVDDNTTATVNQFFSINVMDNDTLGNPEATFLSWNPGACLWLADNLSGQLDGTPDTAGVCVGTYVIGNTGGTSTGTVTVIINP